MQEDANGHVGIGGPADNYYKLRIAGDVYVNDSDSGNGIVLASQLNNRPLISRQMNQFTTGQNAPWIGRWGLFMEQNELLLASPARTSILVACLLADIWQTAPSNHTS